MYGRGRGRGRPGSRKYPRYESEHTQQQLLNVKLRERKKDEIFAKYSVSVERKKKRYFNEDEIVEYLDDKDYSKQLHYDLGNRIDDALAYAFVSWPTSTKVKNKEVHEALVREAPNILKYFVNSPHESTNFQSAIGLAVRCNVHLPMALALLYHSSYYYREEPIVNELIEESFKNSQELLTNDQVNRVLDLLGYTQYPPTFIDGFLYQVSRVRTVSSYQRAVSLLSEFILQQLRRKYEKAFHSLELLVEYFYLDIKRKPMYDAHKRIRRAVRVLYTHLTDGKTSPEIRDMSKKTLVRLTEMGVSLSILKDKMRYAQVELLSIGMKQYMERAQQRMIFTDIEIVAFNVKGVQK